MSPRPSAPAYFASGAGDVNGDGLPDFMVSQHARNNYRGSTFLVYGRDLGRSGALDLMTLGGIEGFRVEGANHSDGSGYALSGMADSNGDGRDELLIGAMDADPLGRLQAGSTYLIYGPGGE